MSHVLPNQFVRSGVPLIPVAVLLAVIGGFYFDSLSDMWSVWRSSESYAHGPLIPLASAWLIWNRRSELASAEFRPYWPAAGAMVVAGFGWLVGRVAGVNTLEQFAVVSLAIAFTVLVLGRRAAITIAFPLGFLFFAVPFGTFLLPKLMEWTADFTVMAVQLSGIPVYREGMTFTLPTGRWSVVESCSGIRYLLAAMPLAFLYAYISYRSLRSRAIFVAMTALVALVANWLRAYLIVMLGHLSDMRIAVGVDHLVYGWLFFGIVMALAFWLGRFLDAGSEPDTVAVPSGHPATSFDATSRIYASLIAGFVLAAAWPPLSGAILNQVHEAPGIASVSSKIDAVNPGDMPPQQYRPHYSGSVAQVLGRSRSDPKVWAMVSVYADQRKNGEMLREANRLTPGQADDSTWQIRSRRVLAPADHGARYPDGPLTEYVVSGPDGVHLVWEWFEVDGRPVVEPARAKLLTAFNVLGGRGDQSAAWFIWTDLDEKPLQARARLSAEATRLGGGALWSNHVARK